MRGATSPSQAAETMQMRSLLSLLVRHPTRLANAAQLGSARRSFGGSVPAEVGRQRRVDWAVHARGSASRLLRELAEQREEVEEDKTPGISSPLEWASPLSVLRYPDPRLRAPNANLAIFDDSVKALAAEMFKLMYE
jgi:hypothetical protein